MKWRGAWRRISSTDPSVDPESITISSQRRYSCAWSAGRVSCNAHPSLKERMIMLANGSLILPIGAEFTPRVPGKTWGPFPPPSEVFTHFRLATPRWYIDQRIVGRSAMKYTEHAVPPRVSIAVRAWNEEAAIRAAL